MPVSEEHSSGRSWGLVAALSIIDLTARLAVPVSLLVLARGHAQAAIGAAVAVNALSVARGLLSGRAIERAIRDQWTALVGATRRYDVAWLKRRDDMHSVAALLEAIANRASFEATILPRLIANGVGIAIVLAAVIVMLGPAWLLLGVVAVAVAGPIVFVGQRRLRRAQAQAYERFNQAARGFEVLMEGAVELRVHGVEERYVTDLLGRIREMAAAERRAQTTSVLLGLLPIGIALLVGIVPLREQLRESASSVLELAEVGILGATALAISVAFLRNLEGYSRSIPFVHTARHYVDGAPSARADGERSVELATVDVRIEDVSVIYEGSDIATPRAATVEWPVGEGLALTGANGAGKTSLAMCLVGLLEPTEGRILWGDVDAQEVAWSEQRGKIAYISQQGFVSGHRSIAWHLRLLCRDAPSDDALRSALREVGLEEALGHRGDVLEIPAAELSGGERKRMHLARALLDEPEIVVFDEPEAGLDAAARVWLRGFVEALAKDKRVVLIAHDESVVPPAFRSLRCARS